MTWKNCNREAVLRPGEWCHGRDKRLVPSCYQAPGRTQSLIFFSLFAFPFQSAHESCSTADRGVLRCIFAEYGQGGVKQLASLPIKCTRSWWFRGPKAQWHKAPSKHLWEILSRKEWKLRAGGWALTMKGNHKSSQKNYPESERKTLIHILGNSTLAFIFIGLN